MNTKTGGVQAVKSLFKAGQFREAEQAARALIASQGESATLLSFLGSALHNQGKHAESEPVLDRSLTINPQQINTLVTQGQNKEVLGKRREALALYRQAGMLTLGDAYISFKIGLLYSRLDNPSEAIKHLNESVRLDPNFAEAYSELGATLVALNDRSSALAALRRAIELKPELTDAQTSLGWLLIRAERPTEAIERFETALKTNPAYDRAYLGLGRAYRDLHRNDEAVASYREALKLDPNSASALHDLSTLKRFSPGDPDIQRMRELLDKPDAALPPRHRIRLACALAKAVEDCGNYDESCALYLGAKREASANSPYSIEQSARFFSRVKAVFDAPTIAAGRARGLRGASPIFVVGLPRSGKTSVAQILGRHPRTIAEPETVGVSWMVERMIPSSEAPFDPAQVQQAILQPNQPPASPTAPAGGPAPIKISSNPGNFQALGVIEMMFPDAKIIHCRRDPLSNCVAIFKSTFNDPRLGYSNNIEDTIEFFRLHEELMDHWRSVLEIPIHEVRFDELMAGGAAAQAALFEACGLDIAELPDPVAELSLGTYLDNGLTSYMPEAPRDGSRHEAETLEAFARQIPALRQLA